MPLRCPCRCSCAAWSIDPRRSMRWKGRQQARATAVVAGAKAVQADYEPHNTPGAFARVLGTLAGRVVTLASVAMSGSDTDVRPEHQRRSRAARRAFKMPVCVEKPAISVVSARLAAVGPNSTAALAGSLHHSAGVPDVRPRHVVPLVNRPMRLRRPGQRFAQAHKELARTRMKPCRRCRDAAPMHAWWPAVRTSSGFGMDRGSQPSGVQLSSLETRCHSPTAAPG